MIDRYAALYLFETAVGLGHQRRSSEIVNALAEEEGFEVSVASGSFVDKESYFKPKVRPIPLPANRRKKGNETYFYDAQNRLVADPHHDAAAWNRERIEAIRPFVEEKPLDVLMIEWFPFQRRKEFGAMIEAITSIQYECFESRPIIISSIRDIVDSRDDGETGRTVELVNRSVDAVLVHSDPALFKLEDVFPQHAEIAKPIIHTGYVVNDQARATSTEPREKHVIVSCGSGDEGHHLLKAAVTALPFTALKDYEWHFILGPRMEEAHRVEFRSVAAHVVGRIVIHDEDAHLPKRLSRAALSISLAGYNTTQEILAARIPAILVAKFIAKGGKIAKLEGEQAKRIRRLGEKDMVVGATPEQALIPEVFANLIDTAFAKGPSSTILDMNGARNTAREVSRIARTRRKENQPLLIPEQAA